MFRLQRRLRVFKVERLWIHTHYYTTGECPYTCLALKGVGTGGCFSSKGGVLWKSMPRLSSSERQHTVSEERRLQNQLCT